MRGRARLNFNSTGAHMVSRPPNQQAGQHQLNHYAGITLLLGDSSRFDGDTTVTGGFLLITNILGTETGRIDAGAAPGASARVNVYNTGATWALTGNLFVGGRARQSEYLLQHLNHTPVDAGECSRLPSRADSSEQSGTGRPMAGAASWRLARHVSTPARPGH